MKRPLSLYLHIPFCQVKCPYCDFFSLAKAEDAIEAYMQTLQKEIRFFAREAGGAYEMQTIFFGGGTPSYIPSRHIAQTLETLRTQFPVATGAEITLEMNPGSFETAKLQDYRSMGITRISMGVQSFDDKELQFLGRVHNAAEAHAAAAAVRDAGFRSFNMDFIFALPGQTPAQWKRTLKAALQYSPPHLSAYNLTYEEGTPLAGQKKQGLLKPLPDGKELRLYEQTIDMVTTAGLAHYEISNFAEPGHEARHNLAYWNGQEYLGLGVAAHSFFKGRRFFKPRSLKHYVEGTTEQYSARAWDEDLDSERRFWELLAIGLRDLRGVPLKDMAARAGRDTPPETGSKLQPWIKQGMLKMQDGRLALTRLGLLHYDRIAAGLI